VLLKQRLQNTRQAVFPPSPARSFQNSFWTCPSGRLLLGGELTSSHCKQSITKRNSMRHGNLGGLEMYSALLDELEEPHGPQVDSTGDTDCSQVLEKLVQLYKLASITFAALDGDQVGSISVGDQSATTIQKAFTCTGLERIWVPLASALENEHEITTLSFLPVFLVWMGVDHAHALHSAHASLDAVGLERMDRVQQFQSSGVHQRNA
jgi:hypothetical protein